MKRCIFFDMDGTLVDSQVAILDSLREAMKAHGLTSVGLSMDVIGPPVVEIIRKVAPHVTETLYGEIVSSFRQQYDAAPERGLRVYEGITELLQDLLSRNFSLYVVTNKPIMPTLRILKFLGWDMFSGVSTPDSWCDMKRRTKSESIAATIHKFRLKTSNVLMVGDTLGDIRAAHMVSVNAVAVLWGYEKNKVGLRKEADVAFSTVQELKYFLLNDIRGCL